MKLTMVEFQKTYVFFVVVSHGGIIKQPCFFGGGAGGGGWIKECKCMIIFRVVATQILFIDSSRDLGK